MKGEISYSMNELEQIQELCSKRKIRVTDHALKRIIERNINLETDVVTALMNGEIIEEYPDDYPYKSFLISGITSNQMPFHVVCAIGEDILWIITEYFPNKNEWEDDYKTRKKV